MTSIQESFRLPLRVARSPISVLFPRHILLLSHMRAYTSLLGHVLGSSPSIRGYYELHIGYYSWRSLYRAQLLYLADNPAKPGSRYLFDKVLHNEHDVNPRLIDARGIKILFSLREPLSAVASIVKLYETVDPTHNFATVQGAANYYIERLNYLGQLAEKLKSEFLYFDAECLSEKTTYTLHTFSEWLRLEAPLSAEYKNFNKTGQSGAGDISASIHQGRIIRSEQSPAESLSIEAKKDAAFWNDLNTIYGTTRRRLTDLASTFIRNDSD